MTIDLNDPIQLALLSTEVLNEVGVAHALYGGLMLAAYGEVRETRDADFAVLESRHSEVQRALQEACGVARLTFEDTVFGGLRITRIAVLGAKSSEGLSTVDLIRPQSDRFAQAVLERSIEAPLRGQSIAAVSPEDFILLKALSTRDRDLDDAASVFRSNAEILDRELLQSEIAQLEGEVDHPVGQRYAEITDRGKVSFPLPH